jgi:hypothetical protein
MFDIDAVGEIKILKNVFDSKCINGVFGLKSVFGIDYDRYDSSGFIWQTVGQRCASCRFSLEMW